MVGPFLEVTVDERVARLKIMDPGRPNALSDDLLGELHNAIDNTDVDAFVLTGAGDIFSAGADITELESGNWRGAVATGPPLLFRRITEDHRPFIAALNGPAYGGGCELALSCDFIAFADDAYLQLPEAGLGVAPNTAAALLAGTLPKQLLMQFLTGRLRLGLTEALPLGIAVFGAPADSVVTQAVSYVRGVLAHCSPKAFTLLKSLLAERDAQAWQSMANFLQDTDDDEVTLGMQAMRARTRYDFTKYWANDRSLP